MSKKLKKGKYSSKKQDKGNTVAKEIVSISDGIVSYKENILVGDGATIMRGLLSLLQSAIDEGKTSDALSLSQALVIVSPTSDNNLLHDSISSWANACNEWSDLWKKQERWGLRGILLGFAEEFLALLCSAFVSGSSYMPFVVALGFIGLGFLLWGGAKFTYAQKLKSLWSKGVSAMNEEVVLRGRLSDLIMRFMEKKEGV